MSHGCLPVFLFPRQAVADAVDGFDLLGCPQLFAKMLNMNVQRAGASAAGITPGLLHQFLPGHHTSTVLLQHGKKSLFLAREVNHNCSSLNVR